MISSMTAFAHVESGHWVWEVRSVNHRYLDISLSLPSAVQMLEPELLKVAKSRINRGRIEASLALNRIDADSVASINRAELQSLYKNIQEVLNLRRQGGDAGTHATSQSITQVENLDVFEILRWPGVLQQSPIVPDAVHEDVERVFDEALTQLIQIRVGEGRALRTLFDERLSQIEAILLDIANQSDIQVQFVRDRLNQRIEKLGVNVDPARLAQEVALLAQKADVSEEIDRLEVHIREFKACMNREEPHGRRLGFLVQEMARESNTLGSKLAAPDAVNLAVNLKVLIDQIREQVQNVE